MTGVSKLRRNVLPNIVIVMLNLISDLAVRLAKHVFAFD